ncbi:MAG: hypothetical protein E7I33_12540 [Mixta calida]|nr:hypothetical protein [Mixta calida]MDU4290269.1 hypothetical protein [Mixta calida]
MTDSHRQITASMHKYGAYGTDYAAECQHVLQLPPAISDSGLQIAHFLCIFCMARVMACPQPGCDEPDLMEFNDGLKLSLFPNAPESRLLQPAVVKKSVTTRQMFIFYSLAHHAVFSCALPISGF